MMYSCTLSTSALNSVQRELRVLIIACASLLHGKPSRTIEGVYELVRV